MFKLEYPLLVWMKLQTCLLAKSLCHNSNSDCHNGPADPFIFIHIVNVPEETKSRGMLAYGSMALCPKYCFIIANYWWDLKKLDFDICVKVAPSAFYWVFIHYLLDSLKQDSQMLLWPFMVASLLPLSKKAQGSNPTWGLLVWGFLPC